MQIIKNNSNISHRKDVFAEDTSDREQAILDKLDELHDTIEDDFDYVLAGIERLGREGKHSQAMQIMQNISNTLNQAISDIGDNFITSEPE